MATRVKFASKAGGEVGGAISEPAAAGKAGAVVVVQEWHGVNAHIESMCDRFASEGFLALAPDLYHGRIATNDGEAAQMMTALDKKKAVVEIGSAVAHLHGHPRCNGKVAVTGFCLGGALTFAAARFMDGIAAAVPFYGLPDVSVDELAKIAAPVQAHFAKVDDWAKASVAEEIQKRIRAAGGQMDLFVYDAGHAFMRAGDPSKHHAESARVAWQRATEFLRKHLA